MANVTGEYDVAVEVSVDAVDRVLAVLHENQDTRYPVLPHSMDMFVDDTYRGAGDPVPEDERTGFQAEVEIQVSTPTLSLPQPGLLTDGVAWVARVVGPWRPPRPADLSIRSNVRAWVKGSPQPPVPEFLHGDVVVNANLVRTTTGTPGLLGTAAGVAFRPVAGVIPTPGDTFVGLDRSSVTVDFQPATGTTVPDDQRSTIEQVIRNQIRADLDPVTFKVTVPDDVKHWDYRLEPDHASVLIAIGLTDRVPDPGAVDGVAGGWIPPGADFAIGVGRDYIVPTLNSLALQGLPDSYSFSDYGVDAEVRPDWSSAGFDLQSGAIVLTVTGDGDISWWGVDDSFSFSVSVGFTLIVSDGALQLIAAGDPVVNLYDVAVGEGYIRHHARDQIRDQRDQILADSADQISQALDVQRQLEEILTSIQPDPPGVALTGVDIEPDGITIPGTISLAPSAPVVVRQVQKDGMIDALDTWIPGGTIDRFRWYRSQPVGTMARMAGSAAAGFSGGATEEHRFVTEEDPLSLAVAGVMCLEVQGTRVTPGGVTAPISGQTCGFYHPVPPWPVTGFPVVGARAWPVLPMLGGRPDGTVGTVGHYSPWASGRAPRKGATTLLVHFANGDRDKTVSILQEALKKHPREAALVVVVLYPDGSLAESGSGSPAWGSEATVLFGEDVDGHWAQTFGVSKRPATVLVDHRGRSAWKEEGTLTASKLARALGQHAEKGGRVSMQPLRLGVVAGDSPPEFPFLAGGGVELSLRRLRGRRVALSFWTSWSEPSVEQLRELARASEAAGGVGPVVLAIGDGETAERAAALARAERLPFPVLPDPEREIARRFGVGCWPATVWIGPNMRVEAVNFGLTAVAGPADGDAASPSSPRAARDAARG